MKKEESQDQHPKKHFGQLSENNVIFVDGVNENKGLVIEEIVNIILSFFNIDNQEVEVFFVKDLDNIEKYNHISIGNVHGYDGSYKVEINDGMSFVEIIRTLGHELTHLKQYEFNEHYSVDQYTSIWKGQEYNIREITIEEYYFLPWEMEARAYEEPISDVVAVYLASRFSTFGRALKSIKTKKLYTLREKSKKAFDRVYESL